MQIPKSYGDKFIPTRFFGEEFCNTSVDNIIERK